VVRRHFFLFAALCVLALMLVAGALRLTVSAFGPQKGTAGGGAGGRSVVVAAAVVGRAPFANKIDVLGVAKGRQSVTITSNTTELITGVHFKDGARVAKGQVLVDLKALEQTANLAQAQATLDLAQLNYDRWKNLGEQGIASSASVDQHRATYAQAKANMEAARSRMGDRVIRAPFSGVVGLSDVAPGSLINPGTPIVSLDDVSVMRVDFEVPDRFMPVLRDGLPIMAHPDSYPNMTVAGRIAKLDSRIDEKTRSITARAELPNRDGKLKPGMLMRVSVEEGVRQAVAAPEAAVLFEADDAFVFVLTKQSPDRIVVVRRAVRTGERQNGLVEITEGLNPGEQIVAEGVNRIQDGQAVSVAGARPGGPGRAR
jgi:membrane fusion protein (multidrug efflux system)